MNRLRRVHRFCGTVRCAPVVVALLLVSGLVAPLAGRQVTNETPQKPGVPGVQHPMARIVPDAEYPVAGSPDWLAMGEDMVWVNSRRNNIVTRMDPGTNDVVAVVPVGEPCSGLIVAAGTLWSPSCSEGVVYRIDVETNDVVAKVPVAPAQSEGGIAFGAGSIWLPSDPAGVVSRIDPATNTVVAAIRVAPESYTAVFGYGYVWVSSTGNHMVSVIDPASNTVVAEIPVDDAPRFMAAGEGFVWTLNQTRGTVTKIDPVRMTAVATIEAGVPGGGGDISAGEGAVWVTARTIPVTRIDPVAEKVTAQFVGPGGDAIRVLHGSVWLSNGRWGNVWRFRPAKLLAAVPPSWTTNAQETDLDADGTPDLLVEDLPVWFPGHRTTVRAKLLGPSAARGLTLEATLNGETSRIPFVRNGEDWEAVYTGAAPRWIHYAVCLDGGTCSDTIVTASPTTPMAHATGGVRFVAEDFAAPGPPEVGAYVWNILEPSLLERDYQALVDRAGPTTPPTLTLAEDYGELKRHAWEFHHHTAFSWGLLSADRTTELGCVYINPSTKEGYDAVVRLWVTRQGSEAGLEPMLEAAVREWIAARWPFENAAFPGRDMSMDEWNALPDARYP